MRNAKCHRNSVQNKKSPDVLYLNIPSVPPPARLGASHWFIVLLLGLWQTLGTGRIEIGGWPPPVLRLTGDRWNTSSAAGDSLLETGVIHLVMCGKYLGIEFKSRGPETWKFSSLLCIPQDQERKKFPCLWTWRGSYELRTKSIKLWNMCILQQFEMYWQGTSRCLAHLEFHFGIGFGGWMDLGLGSRAGQP